MVVVPVSSQSRVRPLGPGDPEAVGPYPLLGRIGDGGMGRVYLARSPAGRFVAVKVVHTDLADDPFFRDRFRHEVAAARRVSGAFTAPVIDADPDAPVPWLATLYVPGPSLAEVVETTGPLPVGACLRLGAGMLEAVVSIHRAGIAHRDIKPSNVLLAPGRVVLTDFGLAVTNGSSTITKAGTFVGSPAYVAPEVARGEKATPESDLWSLGATLYCAVEGRPPFDHDSVMATLSAVLTEDPATPQRAGDLGPIISGLLQRNPKRRLTHARLAERLERASTPKRSAAATVPPESASTLSSAGLPSRRSGAHRAKQSSSLDLRPFVLIGLPALCVIGLVIALFTILGGDDDPAPVTAAPSSDRSTPLGSDVDVVVVKAQGGQCRLTTVIGREGGAAGTVNNVVVGDGQVARYNSVPMDLTVSDGQVCQVTINGEVQPSKAGEQTFRDIDKE
jgi:serine/threonine protein kinase